MRLDCAYVEEAIWNMARGKHELTADEFNHIEHCHSCKQAMADVEPSLGAFELLKPCPPAPDCRDRIMSRISPIRPTRSRIRFAWAAIPMACAAIILAALFFTGNNRRVEITKPVQSTASNQHKTPSADRSAHVSVAQKPAQSRTIHIAAAPSRSAQRPAPHKCRHISIGVRNTPSHMPTIAKMTQERQMIDVAKPVASASQRQSEPGSAVKAVSLIWSPVSGNGEVSYQYSEKNSATGEVTITHTRITNDSIDVRVESDKAPQKPTSEMIDLRKAADSGLV